MPDKKQSALNVLGSLISISRGLISPHTRLVRSILKGNRKTVERLLRRGVPPDVYDPNSDEPATPLCLCAARGFEDIAGVLIAYGASPNLAVERRTFLHGKEISTKVTTALCEAVYHGERTVGELLLDKGADPNCKVVWTERIGEGSPLINVSESKWTSSTRVENTVVSYCFEATPVSLAVLRRDSAMLSLLLERGGSMLDALEWSEERDLGKFEGKTGKEKAMSDLLLDALEKGRPKIGELALRRGANPNSRCPWISHEVSEGPALHRASYYGDVAFVRLLLEYGADSNYLHHKKTALGLAAWLNFPQVVEVLLQHGADPNLGMPTPLDLAHEVVFRPFGIPREPRSSRWAGSTTTLLTKYGGTRKILRMLNDSEASSL